MAAIQDGTGLKAGQRDTRGAGEHPRGPPAQPEDAQERDLFQDTCILCRLLRGKDALGGIGTVPESHSRFTRGTVGGAPVIAKQRR